jgi:tetratricopeptide (TPR) repeat protein
MYNRRMPACGRVSLVRCLWFLALLSNVLCAALVRANDFEEFDAARNAYESQDYARAARLFEQLGGGDTPSITNRSLLLESKKYLGASYLFLGKLPQAEAEFARLLRLDPQYLLDPLGFPEEVQRLFAQIKARLDSERRVAEEERRREEERKKQLEEQRLHEVRARWERLVALAQTEKVQEKRSRWIALIPFGVGQVQNGHGSLGAVLAVSEGSLLAISLVSWIIHENLRGEQPGDSQRDEFNVTERVSRYTNQVSLALFGALALTGIIDAQARFQGDVEHTRRRTLPPELREPPRISVGPRGLSLSIKF